MLSNFELFKNPVTSRVPAFHTLFLSVGFLEKYNEIEKAVQTLTRWAFLKDFLLEINQR